MEWAEVEEERKAKLGKFGKDPTVETSFLPDRYEEFIQHVFDLSVDPFEKCQEGLFLPLGSWNVLHSFVVCRKEKSSKDKCVGETQDLNHLVCGVLSPCLDFGCVRNDAAVSPFWY